MSLYDKILNMPSNPSLLDKGINDASTGYSNTIHQLSVAYLIGHRDARHAAAEMANEYSVSGDWIPVDQYQKIDGKIAWATDGKKVALVKIKAYGKKAYGFEHIGQQTLTKAKWLMDANKPCPPYSELLGSGLPCSTDEAIERLQVLADYDIRNPTK